ncbi:MAG: alpha/beta hydrolase [Archangium gephyra]|uniref:Alpha/beta hydrolase n=1 Tax=Archangium gephyra TaxID=48 RepID=A0A2W5TQG2_9BACT|nr:MAG: alpha/beta hydrolase [Archangium gephyra]
MTFDMTPYKSLYPWKPNFLDVGQGVKLHYLDEGQGDPLVMLHGNPTWSFYWRNLVTKFSKDHRVIVPDHVGCGLSDKPGDEHYEYVLERRVADLDRLINSLDLGDRITLVVHDWGGMIGMAWATKNPHRVKRFVVLNTAGFGLPQGRKLPWQIGVVRYAPFFPVPVRAFNAFSRGANLMCSTRPGRMTPLIKDAYLAPYDSWKNRIAVQRFVEDIPLAPGDRSWPIVNEVSEKLEQFRKVPMLICWGRKDFVFDDAFLAEWRKRLPEAQVHVFEDAGHYVLEDAHEEISRLMHDFFAKNPLPGRDA